MMDHHHASTGDDDRWETESNASISSLGSDASISSITSQGPGRRGGRKFPRIARPNFFGRGKKRAAAMAGMQTTRTEDGEGAFHSTMDQEAAMPPCKFRLARDLGHTWKSRSLILLEEESRARAKASTPSADAKTSTSLNHTISRPKNSSSKSARIDLVSDGYDPTTNFSSSDGARARAGAAADSDDRKKPKKSVSFDEPTGDSSRTVAGTARDQLAGSGTKADEYQYIVLDAVDQLGINVTETLADVFFSNTRDWLADIRNSELNESFVNSNMELMCRNFGLRRYLSEHYEKLRWTPSLASLEQMLVNSAAGAGAVRRRGEQKGGSASSATSGPPAANNTAEKNQQLFPTPNTSSPHWNSRTLKTTNRVPIAPFSIQNMRGNLDISVEIYHSEDTKSIQIDSGEDRRLRELAIEEAMRIRCADEQGAIRCGNGSRGVY